MDIESEAVLYLVYLMVWRLSVVLVGAMSIYLGFRLFLAGIASTESSLEASHGGTSLVARNLAPGTAYALFGIALIGVLVGTSPAEVVSFRDGAAGEGARAGVQSTGVGAREVSIGTGGGGIIVRGDERGDAPGTEVADECAR